MKKYTVNDLYAGAWQNAVESVAKLLDINVNDVKDWEGIEGICEIAGVQFDENGDIVGFEDDEEDQTVSVYTQKDWEADRAFSAKPGQEIEREIFYEMMESMPSLSFPRCEQTREYSRGFLAGEPYDFDTETHKIRYMAFGRKDNRYYYVGLLPAAEEV